MNLYYLYKFSLYTLSVPFPSFQPPTMSILDSLPPSLNLPPHLSAHKYFLVCTLTVAAWDSLVLSPRTWRLMKTPGWPALKILFNFLRVFMPVEFIIVGEPFLCALIHPHSNLVSSGRILRYQMVTRCALPFLHN